MSSTIDSILAFLKWPVAVVAVLLVPGSLLAAFEVVSRSFENPWPVIYLMAGSAMYLLAWKVIFKRAIWGTWFSTLEHEITHAIFALLTFHWVTGLRTTYNQGGSMSYTGKGNWLITISPYFFPTFSVLLLLLFGLISEEDHIYVSLALGVSVCYHMISTFREFHPRQTDLQKVGFIFAYLFLPVANLLCFVGIFAFAYGGIPATLEYAGDVVKITIDLGRDFIN